MRAKYIISSSGGLGSAISALICHMHKLDYEMVFADTLIEDEDLYRFLHDIERVTGKEIVWLKDGRTPWDVFIDNKFIGNSRIAHCSQELKTATIFKCMNENCQPSDKPVLGMDMSEIDRIERAQKNWHPREVVSLLNNFRIWRHQYDAILKHFGLTKPRLYELGFPHNNCGGFCVRAGLKQFATLLKWFPKRFLFHENEEQRAIAAIGPTARPFLRYSENYKTEYITLREFRQLVEKGLFKPKLYEASGCACFVD